MGSFGAKKGQFVPKQALSGLLAANKRPNTRSKSIVTMSPTHAQQPGGFGTKSGPFGPSEDFQDPQKGHFGPKTGPFLVPGGKKEAQDQAKVCGKNDSNPVRTIGRSWDQIWTLRALGGPPEPPKGTFWAKTGSFGAPGGQEESQYQAKVCGNHDSNPVRPICDNRDQIWP